MWSGWIEPPPRDFRNMYHHFSLYFYVNIIFPVYINFKTQFYKHNGCNSMPICKHSDVITILFIRVLDMLRQWFESKTLRVDLLIFIIIYCHLLIQVVRVHVTFLATIDDVISQVAFAHIMASAFVGV